MKKTAKKPATTRSRHNVKVRARQAQRRETLAAERVLDSLVSDEAEAMTEALHAHYYTVYRR